MYAELAWEHAKAFRTHSQELPVFDPVGPVNRSLRRVGRLVAWSDGSFLTRGLIAEVELPPGAQRGGAFRWSLARLVGVAEQAPSAVEAVGVILNVFPNPPERKTTGTV